MKRVITIGLLIGLATASGCIAVGGSERYDSKVPTLGRELQDLKTARDTGAISPEEHDKTRTALMSSAEKR